MIERYTVKERVIHWIAGLTYVYLLLTGLAFYSPNLWWIATMFGGGPVVRYWHPIAGLAFVVSVLWMYSEWGREMRMTAADRQWAAGIRYYVSHQDNKLPPVGKYNGGQKQFFWIMFFAALALLVSGMALWWTEAIPWNLRWIRFAAVLLHVTAFLASVAGFIVHVYMGTTVVKGGFTAMTRGKVTEQWARHHHPLWK